MDCLKNLTACMGCTKKHAKCSWKEVREVELRGGVSHHVPSSGGVHSESEDLDPAERDLLATFFTIADEMGQGPSAHD